MKILLLSHHFYPSIGGIEINSEVLANEFTKAGHEVKVLTQTADPGTKTFPYSIIRKPSLRQLFMEHRDADVIFENNPCLQMSWINFFLRKPNVIALRTWIERVNGELGWQDKLKYKWLRLANGVIANSEAVRLKCFKPAIVIGNPYRKDLFVVKQESYRKNDFVFLGRLVSDKGADLAIEALCQIIKQHKDIDSSNCQLTIIGDGPEKESLQQLAASLNISKHVHFTGAMKGETLVRELNKHLFLLVPSRWEEPFGNVALEGMACGCIPIVSDGGGLPDAVGNAGVLFKRGDADALAKRIQELICKPERITQLREAATIHLKAHQPEVVANRYLDVITNAFEKER
jgi:glycosyltransferase involved in cell wall biosynthesis